MAKLPRAKIPLSAVVYALMPKGARRGMGILLLLMFGPTLFILLVVAVDKLFRLMPFLWVLVVLIVLYRIGRWLFGRY